MFCEVCLYSSGEIRLSFVRGVTNMQECSKSCINSIEIGRAALRIALTSSRVEETKVKERLAEHGIRSTAVDFGGEFIPSIVKIVERAVVAAQRQGYPQWH